MTSKASVLIVEDEAAVSDHIAAVLAADNYRPLKAETGAFALSMVSSHCPDVILLNLGLPDMDGMEVLKAVRKWSGIPIIIVSARGNEKTKVQALDSGADDYITKPFGTAELLARIRTAIRHGMKMESGEDLPGGVYRRGGLFIDFERHLVTVDGRDVHLTPIEFKIVSLVASHAGNVLTYSHIIHHVWGNFAQSDHQILRVNMANIRRKIEQDPAHPRYIQTVAGVGYRMSVSGKM
ncbi:response regulator transcription factor [Caproiciproducens galactitolivorans]|uniref:Stage 0 sporulation protein A homolog n=1 Tax=Caproiciproducens galactitolivorans TaxID=642589 RepID=A0A4Z0YCY4_9FIRM|nr:response regulator transcription factor [Caproiciproducens galactitolivorans]QEY35120.1 response regulator transcription factor [Caproiciproducens galactitolivorans]TGJ76653.1 KDP operon transcriptional regulatory protein KdpE [Caproiciproducens galactitolivorans]